MASNRFAARRAQRVKVNDENITAHGPVRTKRTLPVFPPSGAAQRIPIITKAAPVAAGTQRAALGEVTVNYRKNSNIPSKLSDTGDFKHSKSSSITSNTTVSQRVPQSLVPTSSFIDRPASRVPRVPAATGRINPRAVDVAPSVVLEENDEDGADIPMDLEEPEKLIPTTSVENGVVVETGSEDEDIYKTEVEAMVGVESAHTLRALRPRSPVPTSSSPLVPRPSSVTQSSPSADVPVWPAPSSPRTRAEIQRIRDEFVDEIDVYDTTLVSEYADDIFAYMGRLEEESMPGDRYVEGQGEINWEMRQTLVDWLLQVHFYYRLLPETLWIAVNIIDRFLTKRVVRLAKLQLVGVTAMFIAAKFEEIIAPSVDEFVFMTENGIQKEEILKGERIILQTLDFRISSYCTPYSWVRKISKADDYDLHTRTLSKFLMDVTLLDHRFLRVKPSLIAAVGMYSAVRMLGGEWNEAFIYYSGFTEVQVKPGHDLLVQKLLEPNFNKLSVYEKYLHKKFLKASSFALEWAMQAASNVEVGRTGTVAEL